MMVAPDYLHLTGYFVPLTFWGGIALAVALIFVAAAIAWRGEKADEKAAVSPSSNAPRNIPLLDAIWRAHLGRWGERADYGSDPDAAAAFHKTVSDIRQMARDGKLPIWGTTGQRAIFDPVPLNFWSTHDIEAEYIINPLVKDIWVCVVEPTKIGQTKNARARDWTNFMTSREVVEELWPAFAL